MQVDVTHTGGKWAAPQARGGRGGGTALPRAVGQREEAKGRAVELKQAGGFTPPMPRVSTQARDARTAQGWRTEEETAAGGRGLVSDLVLEQREVMRLRVVVQAQERFNRRLESQHQADVRRVREVKALGRRRSAEAVEEEQVKEEAERQGGGRIGRGL